MKFNARRKQCTVLNKLFTALYINLHIFFCAQFNVYFEQ